MKCIPGVYKTDDLMIAGVLSIGDGYRAKNSELAASGLPFARAGNIDNGFRFDGADCFPFTNLSKVGVKVSRPGDVVFTSKGTVGRFAFVRDDTPTFVFSPQLCYWRSLDTDTIEPRWLYYWMNGQEFWEQASGLKGQTDMADYVSLSDQRRMTLTLPHIDEQRAIADVLGALDDKIEHNRRTAQTLERFARALFKAWFVEFEPVKAKADGATAFPGMPQSAFDALPTEFQNSELGPIPNGWQAKPLSTVGMFLNGLPLQKYPPRGDGQDLPVIKIAQLRKGSSDGTDWANSDVPPNYLINDNDLLFSWSGTLEVELWFGGPGALNQHLFKVSSDQFPQWFCLLWLRHHLPQFRAIAASKATTMGHIQRKHLDDAHVAIPPTSCLNAANAVLGPAYALYAHLQTESRKLAEMRDVLLPKLLSGAVRVAT